MAGRGKGERWDGVKAKTEREWKNDVLRRLERLADRWVEAVEPELWAAGAENSSQGSIRQSPE